MEIKRNYIKKLGRSADFQDMGVHDYHQPFAGSTASTGAPDTSGTDDDPNQDTGTGDAPFAILINGSAPSQSGSTVIPSSSFTIGCNSGNFTITRAGIDAGGTSPQTLGPEELDLNTNFSGTFTTGDGFKDFIVFGVVVFSKNSEGRANAIVNENAGGTYNTRIYVRDAEDSTPKFVEGFSDKDTANPLYMFRIGTVRSTKSGSLRRVYVTQSVVGNDEIGDDLPDPDSGGFFEIIKTDDNKFKVSFGVVNDTVEPPQVIGGSNETEFSTSGNLTYVYLKLTLDAGDQSVTTAEITTTRPIGSETIARIQIGWLKLEWKCYWNY